MKIFRCISNHCVYLKEQNTFDFGNVFIGDDFYQRFSLRNTGNFACECCLTLISEFDAFGLTNNKYSLTPGQRIEIDILVKPLINKSISATLVIEIEPNSPPLQYLLQVVGCIFEFVIDEKMLIFEKKIKFLQKHHSFNLRNLSKCDVAFYFDNLKALDTYFKVAPDLGVIGAGQTREINVKFLRSEIFDNFSKILTLVVSIVFCLAKKRFTISAVAV